MASKRHVRRQSCEGKVRHTDADEAQREARRLAYRNRDGFWPYEAYRCPHCGGYHVGHERRRSGKRRRDLK